MTNPSLHAKLSPVQLQKQNEEAEAWLAKHKPDLLNEEVFKVTPRNQHKHQLVVMQEKKAKQRFKKLLSSKDKVLELCGDNEFVSAIDLAKLIGVHRSTLIKWCELVGFPKVKVFQSKHFYDAKELKDFFVKKVNPCKGELQGLKFSNQKGR